MSLEVRPTERIDAPPRETLVVVGNGMVGQKVLNLLTASLPAEALAHGYNPHKQTNTFNPFAAGNADALKEMMASQLGEAPSNDSNGVFRGRAIALIGTLASPVRVRTRATPSDQASSSPSRSTNRPPGARRRSTTRMPTCSGPTRRGTRPLTDPP